MDCVSTFQFVAIILQIIGTIIIISQALRGQLKIDSDVSMNEKGHIIISSSLAAGILLIIGGLLLEAFMFTDFKFQLCM